jgi:hypothetical protein
MEALTLVGMQGIINRDGPMVYLNWISKDNENSSAFWLQLLRQQVQVVDENLDGLGAIQFLYQLYGPEFAGAVVYDPNVPDTINVATMIAGLENRVMLAPQQLNASGMPQFSSVVDLRQLVTSQDWNNTAAGVYKIYQWVYDNLWPQLEHRMIAVISPGPPTSGPSGGGQFFPLGLAIRDYLVALRLPVIWLSPTEEPEASLLEQFLAAAPSPIPILGVYSGQEIDSVSLFSRYGDSESGLGWDNEPLSCGDLTVLSGIRPTLEQYQPAINPDSLFATLGNKSVMTIWSSDGDNLQFQLDRGFHGLVNWVWEDVQGDEFGWSMNPTLADLAPLVWNYYVGSARNVSLLSGLSGAGYMFPALMTEPQLQAYLTYSRMYMNETGIRSLWLSNSYLSPILWNNTLAQQYYGALNSSGYLGAYACDSCYPLGLGFGYFGVPTPTAFASYDLNSTNGGWIINQILSREPGTDFIDLSQSGLGLYSGGQVVTDSQAVNGRALFFSTDQQTCCLAVGTPPENLAPGNYTITFRLKVDNNTSSLPVAELYAGTVTEGGGWNFLAREYISPNEFARSGQYQNVTLSLELKNLTSNIEFRMDYYGGLSHPQGSWASTDLYADYITSSYDGNLGLPVFSAVFLPLVTNPQRLTEAPQIGENFELAGGLTLSPDEFLATLNPQFMIQWATPILGSGNPGLVAARAQLASGDFLNSLLSVRNALKNLSSRTYSALVNQAGNQYNVSVEANSWITNIWLNQTSDELSFLMHGPPGESVQATASVPNEIISGHLNVEVDGHPQAVTPVKGASYATIALNLSPGPHRIVVQLGIVIQTTTTTSTTSVATTTLATTTSSTTSSFSSTTFSSPTQTTSSSSTATSSSSTTPAIPEFPYQVLAIPLVGTALVVSYLLIRRRLSPLNEFI